MGRLSLFFFLAPAFGRLASALFVGEGIGPLDGVDMGAIVVGFVAGADAPLD